MWKDWREIEIKNFRGISQRRTPSIEECANCFNLDLRGPSGDLVSVPNPTAYLSAPDFSSQGFTLVENLGFTTHVFSQLGGVSKEVTFYFQRGTVNSLPHVAVGMYPYFNGSTWINGWIWLNAIYFESITYANSYEITTSVITHEKGMTLYNVTKDEWATVMNLTGLGTGNSIISVLGWQIGDDVISMRNYQPLGGTGGTYPYYTAQSSIAAADLVYHRILSDLRVGFGSASYRLGIGVGYRNKYWNIYAADCGVTNNLLSGIFLDPYNSISDNGTYLMSDLTTYSGVGNAVFPSAAGNTFYVRMTAVLDDLSEFLVAESTVTHSASGRPWQIGLKPKIRFATMNKRVTKVRFWLACSSAGSSERSEDYRLCKEMAVSNPSSSESIWKLDSTGFLIEANDTINSIHLTYSDYAGNTETQGLRMSEALGYTPTLEYVASWDQALVANNSTYVLNPYDSKPWKNFIFNSPISGAGAAMYDVIMAGNYKSLDTKDGNDIVGIELNSNLDFTIFRNNGYQQYDPIRQIPSQIVSGIGTISRRGIININNTLLFPSQYDAFALRGNQSQNITEDTIRDEYRTAIATVIGGPLGGKENYGLAYRLFDGASEYIFVPDKGWINYDDGGQIIAYGNTYDGYLLKMLASGAIVKMDNSVETFVGSDLDFYWESIPIDISLLGEGITSDERIIIGSVWIEYRSPVALTAQISYNGGAYGGDRTFASQSTLNKVEKRFPPGHNAKYFSIKISGKMVAGAGVTYKSQIAAIGIRWKTFKTGLFR